MATHSYAYIPTNRVPGEYIMSEGWSNGMLDSVGLGWYQSVPRMDEAIRATLLLGGSPVFAPAGETTFKIKEIDYIEEGVTDDMEEEDENFVAGVAITVEALTDGDWATAESTAYGKMTLEEKMAMGITLNTLLHNITDFADVPTYGEAPIAYDLPTLLKSLTEHDPDVLTDYFYHSSKQWWGLVQLSDERLMWLPLVVAFALEPDDAFPRVKELHSEYPVHYAKDIEDLATFEAARSK